MPSSYDANGDRRRRRVQAIGLVLAAFLTGLAAGDQFSGQKGPAGDGVSSARACGAVPAATGGRPLPGPTIHTDGAPGGFARTEQGAVEAAAAFVTTGQALLDMDPLAAEEAVRSMAASATADTQVEETLAGLAAVRGTLAPGTGPIVFRQSPISWRVDGFTPVRARVAIWGVGVLSREGIAPPQAGWTTSTFDLVWERGDWRIWAETVTPGPAPLLDDSAAPATSGQLAAALRGFTDFGDRT